MKPFLVLKSTAVVAAVVAAVASIRASQSEPAPGAEHNLSASAGVSGARPGPASDSSERSLRTLVQEAELVFEGRVVDVTYAPSLPAGPGQRPVAHTFVTYAVDSLLSGTNPGSTVTLRFVGGQDPETHHYLQASIVPQFDVGDRDVLFVAGNGESMCPLVRERSGRLRIIDGQVYSDTGRSIHLLADEMLQVGPHFRLEAVRTTSILGHFFETEVALDALPLPSDAVTADELLAAIKQLAEGVPAPSVAFRSTLPWEPFVGPDATPSAPLPDAPQQIVVSDEERAQQVLDYAAERAARRSIDRTQEARALEQVPATEKRDSDR
jgi:hypothetical protein